VSYQPFQTPNAKAVVYVFHVAHPQNSSEEKKKKKKKKDA
jgi:hypothetical protein